MIPARKSTWFVRWFAKQTDKRIRSMFSKVYVRGEDAFLKTLQAMPVLAVSNHTAWWDPMFAVFVGHGLAAADAYAMMDAKNLARLPFLGRIGGFGVHLDDPADRRRVLKYTAALLDKPGRLVWMFPEGAEKPRAIGVDTFLPGAAIIAKRAPSCAVVPVGLRYEFCGREHPEAFISIGAPMGKFADTTSASRLQREAVCEELARIDAFVLHRNEADGFSLKMQTKPSRMGSAAERVLAFVTRYPKGEMQ